MLSTLDVFLGIFVYRYLRLFVNLFAFTRLKPIPLPEDPQLKSQDVTVVIPSIEGHGSILLETLETILRTEPFEVIIVTIDANLHHAQRMIDDIGSRRIRALSIAYPNKRHQIVRAIPEIRTAITVFADDDVLWPVKLLQWMLAPLEDESFGGVGTNQRLRRAENPTFSQRIYGFLNALYLERRNFDCAACMYMDGGLPCLSGRTVAFRTSILQDEAFQWQFTHEEWLGRYRLNADDDNFITRWLVTHKKRIAYQYHKEAEVLTTLEDNPKFIKQCLRWSRSNWRSNLTSMFWDRQIWRSQPWSTYAVHQTTLFQWGFLSDCIILYAYMVCSQQWTSDLRVAGFYALITWMFISKFIKLLGHYIRYPVDIVLLPVSIIFGYLHGLIKARAMMTLDVTAWGTRTGADDEDAYRMIRVYSKAPSAISWSSQSTAKVAIRSEMFTHRTTHSTHGSESNADLSLYELMTPLQVA